MCTSYVLFPYRFPSPHPKLVFQWDAAVSVCRAWRIRNFVHAWTTSNTRTPRPSRCAAMWFPIPTIPPLDWVCSICRMTAPPPGRESYLPTLCFRWGEQGWLGGLGGPCWAMVGGLSQLLLFSTLHYPDIFFYKGRCCYQPAQQESIEACSTPSSIYSILVETYLVEARRVLSPWQDKYILDMERLRSV
jgi:hypothetical protein